MASLARLDINEKKVDINLRNRPTLILLTAKKHTDGRIRLCPNGIMYFRPGSTKERLIQWWELGYLQQHPDILPLEELEEVADEE